MSKNFLILIFALVLTSGCDRSRKGPVAEPSGDVSSISGFFSIVTKDDFPYADAYVKVQDDSGNAITDLLIGNLVITEDSKPTVPLDVEVSYGPLSVILILDRSGSMYGDPTTDLNEAAVAFVEELAETDYVEIIDFGSDVEVTLEFTNDKDALIEAIEDGDADMGMTALYDAIATAVDEMEEIGGTKVIIAMTDGADTASDDYSLSSVITYANASNQAINTIGYTFGGLTTANLQQIADDTGGIHDTASTGDELFDVYQDMVPEPVLDHIKVMFKSFKKKADEITMYVVYGPHSTNFSNEYADVDDND